MMETRSILLEITVVAMMKMHWLDCTVLDTQVWILQTMAWRNQTAAVVVVIINTCDLANVRDCFDFGTRVWDLKLVRR